MRKKLWIVLCALVLVGCAVDGDAVAEDAWHGLGISRSPAPSQTQQPAPATTLPSTAVDPCEFDEIRLSVAVGVDPETKTEVPDGCSWSGEGIQFVAMLASRMEGGTVADVPGVSDVDEVQVGDLLVQVFVFQGDSCAAKVDIGDRTLHLILVEDDFDASCLGFRVAAQMLLGGR